MTRLLSVLLLIFVAGHGWASESIAEKRLVYKRDTDFFGGDLNPVFDIDRAACERVCLADDNCVALTYNARSRACFPKAAVDRQDPFTGALSARVVVIDPGMRERADDRARMAAFLNEADLAEARNQAQGMGAKFPGGAWPLATLLETVQHRRAADDLQAARYWQGAAVAQGDDVALWHDFARLSRSLASQTENARQKKRLDRSALSALVNAYLRADAPDAQSGILRDMAPLLETARRGRDMVAALRLAQALRPTDDIADRLDRALAKHGFRILETRVENDDDVPRICMRFSEELSPRADYLPYLRVNGAEPVLDVSGANLCLTGLEHGARYEIALREGLPAKGGETLHKAVRLQHYMRDRPPSVRFAGRAYVLPRGRDAALPVVSVNTDALDVVLHRVDDRNLLRVAQDNMLGRSIQPYEQERFAQALATEIWRGTAEVDTTRNRETTTRLPLTDALADQPPGLFVLRARAAGTEAKSAAQWFVLTDLGLSSFGGADGTHVAVNALATAEPKPGVRIELLSRANRVLAEAETGADGLAHFAPGLMRGTDGAAPAMLVAKTDDDMAFLSLTDPAFDLSDRGVEGRPAVGPVDVFLTTDRGAYRAGETIHLTALARDTAAAAITGLPLTAVLTRPDGVEARRLLSTSGALGGHVFAFTTSTDAPRGTWQLAVFADPEADALARARVLVEDFIPERIDVTLGLDAARLDPAALPDLAIAADYLFGAPARDLPVEARIGLRALRQMDDWPGYRFGREDAELPSRMRYLKAPRTGADGTSRVALSLPEMPVEGFPVQAEMIVSVTEGSGRPVERRLVRPVMRDAPLIGIRPLFDEIAPEGGEAEFSVLTLRNDALTDMPVEWHLNRVTTRYEWYELYGRWNWEATTSRQRVASGTLRSKDGRAELSTPVDWGEYELVLRNVDGPDTESALRFWAGWYAPADTLSTPDTISVSLDAPSYAPGDTAELLIEARHSGVARIAVLSDRVISMQSVALEAGPTRLRLPVSADWGTGAYVTVQLIHAGTEDRFAPGRALGLAHAAIDPGDKALGVTLDVPDTARPRGRMSVALQIDGLAQGEAAMVTLAAVDAGILNLTGFEPPDPGLHYFGKRQLGVDLRDLYGRLIDTSNGALGRMRQGGDANRPMTLEARPPTQDLLALFSGPVSVGADGRAEIAFDLPAFNGTVRLMAVAWSARGVGAASRDVILRDPVVLSASLPRFLAPGDESRALFDLTHVDGAAGDVTLRVSAPGLMPEAETMVPLAQGGTARIELPLTPQIAGVHDIAATLELPNGETLTHALRLDVRNNDPRITRQRRVTLAAGEALTLDQAVFAGLRAASADVLLSAGPMARFDVPRLLSDLDRYPYGCTEQLTSQAMPLLYLSDVAGGLELARGSAAAARIAAVIDRVLARQTAGGSFGLWQAQSGDFWLDAYVTDFLGRARAAGHQVPPRAFEAALDNLANRVSAAPDFDDGGEDIAYALMVLAREGRGTQSDLRYFADARAGAFGSPLALAQLGAGLALFGETDRSKAMFLRASAKAAGLDAERAIWRADYGTPLRDTAGVLALAQQSGVALPEADALMQRVARADGHLSTQEQAWLLLAAHERRAALAGASVTVDGQMLDAGQAQRFTAAEPPRRISNNGQAPLPVTLTITGRPEAGRTDPGGTGYRLNRSYYTLDGAAHEGPFAMGERYVTVLRVTPVQESGARLMIDDPLPAGLEIDNPSLLRSGDIAGLDWLTTAETRHAEFRDDRFLAAVDHRGAKSFDLAYIVRAVSPGAFHHPAASVEDMYRPQERGHTGSGRVRVLP